jgi:hypothetical protein
MEVEVVAAGVAMNELRRNRHGRSQKYEGEADEATIERWTPSSQKREMKHTGNA